MAQRDDPQHYLELGDRLLRRGNLCLAGRAYARHASLCLARVLLERASRQADSEPLQALAALARVERLKGPTEEGWAVAVQAYEQLGEWQIAERYRQALGVSSRSSLSLSGACPQGVPLEPMRLTA